MKHGPCESVSSFWAYISSKWVWGTVGKMKLENTTLNQYQVLWQLAELTIQFFFFLFFFFFHQGPRHTPQMHGILQVYCATLNPPWFGRSHFCRQVSPRPHDARDPSSEMWNLRARIVR